MNSAYISVENVNYSYEKSHPILKDITSTSEQCKSREDLVQHWKD